MNDTQNTQQQQQTQLHDIIIKYHEALMSYPESYIFLNKIINIPNHFINKQNFSLKFSTLIDYLKPYNEEPSPQPQPQLPQTDTNTDSNSDLNTDSNAGTAGIATEMEDVNIIDLPQQADEDDKIIKIQIKYDLNTLLNEIKNEDITIQEYINKIIKIFQINNLMKFKENENENDDETCLNLIDKSIIKRICTVMINKISDDQNVLKKINLKRKQSSIYSDKIFKNKKIIESNKKLKKQLQQLEQQPNNNNNNKKEEKIIKKSKKEIKKENKFKLDKLKHDNLSIDNKLKFKFEYILDQVEPPTGDINEDDDPFYLHQSKKLFKFQKLSIKKMIERETNPKDYLDPTWKIIEGDEEDGSGEIKLYNLLKKDEEIKCTNRNDIPKCEDIKGGILCQAMGTGKTIICLGLILSTLGSQSRPPIFPPLSESNRIECVIINNNSNSNSTTSTSTSSFKQPESLYNLCIKNIKQKFGSISYNSNCKLPLDIRNEIDNYPNLEFKLIKYPQEIVATKSSRIHSYVSRKLINSSTTLLIVPNQILKQWVFEILLHDKLKYYVIENNEKSIPSPKELIKYDIVLITTWKLSNLKSLNNSTSIWKSEEEMEESDDNDDELSIFKINWLRIIIDEGHVIGNNYSSLNENIRFLISERKWVCSGTPISGSVLSSELINFRSICNFLNIEPYAGNGNQVYNSLILNPVNNFKVEGIDRICKVMNRIAIRTPIDEIQKQINLPPLSIKLVPIDLNHDFDSNSQQQHLFKQQILKYNELVCLIQVNLLASQYTGRDSFAHSENQQLALQAFTNLRKACFDCDFLKEDQRIETRDNIETTLLKSDTIIPYLDKLKLLQIYKYFELISKFNSIYIDKSINLSNFYFYKSEIITPPPQTEDINLTTTTTTTTTTSTVRFKLTDEEEEKEKLKEEKEKEKQLQIIEPKIKLNAKLEYLINRLIEIVELGEKCIIFSEFNDHIKQVVSALSGVKELSKIFKIYMTELTLKQRANIVSDFQTKNCEFKILIMNSDLAAYGLNLTESNHIIFIDIIMFNNSKEQQAIKRSHRIGQTKPVYVEKLIIQNSCEQQLININNELINKNNQSSLLLLTDGSEQQQQQQDNNSKNNNIIKDEFLFTNERKEEDGKRIVSLLTNLNVIPSDDFQKVTDDEFKLFMQYLENKNK